MLGWYAASFVVKLNAFHDILPTLLKASISCLLDEVILFLEMFFEEMTFGVIIFELSCYFDATGLVLRVHSVSQHWQASTKISSAVLPYITSYLAFPWTSF